MASDDVKALRDIVAGIETSSTAEKARKDLATLLKRMYEDLDKTVRRCDEHSLTARWVAQFGAAATAAASAIAGTTLLTGASGRWALVVGATTAFLGVVGSVAAALKLNESVQRNRADHAQYLPILRHIGTYAAVDLPVADLKAIRKQLDLFARQIAEVEANAAAEA